MYKKICNIIKINKVLINLFFIKFTVITNLTVLIFNIYEYENI